MFTYVRLYTRHIINLYYIHIHIHIYIYIYIYTGCSAAISFGAAKDRRDPTAPHRVRNDTSCNRLYNHRMHNTIICCYTTHLSLSIYIYIYIYTYM